MINFIKPVNSKKIIVTTIVTVASSISLAFSKPVCAASFQASLDILNFKNQTATVDVRGTLTIVGRPALTNSLRPFPIQIPPGQGVNVKFRIPDFVTDLAIFTDPDGVTSSTFQGYVSGSSGSLFLENYTEASLSILESMNIQQFFAPVIFSQDQNTSLFIGIDLNQWIPSNTEFEIGDTFNFTNGVSSDAPGIIVGTSEILFDRSVGWITLNPFTGTGVVVAKSDGETVSEPSSILSLVSLGTLGAASTLKRKLKSSQSTEKKPQK